LATLPLILYYFPQFPLYFLIANLTVVPFAGLLLATALLALAAGNAGWLTALLRLQLQAVDHITRWVSSLPSALLDNLYCDLPMLLFLFLALYLFTLWLRDKKPWALPATVASLLLLAFYLLALRHHLFGLG
jgi:competence protein ComEC